MTLEKHALTASRLVLLQSILSIRRPHGGAGEEGILSAFSAMGTRLGHPTIYERGLYCEVTIPGNPRILHCAHADTVDRMEGKKPLVLDRTNGILSTDHKENCLGADDGAGVFILLEMVKAGIPGIYVLFAGEERGCIGSSVYPLPDSVDWCLEYDRRGTDEIIYRQLGQNTADSADAAYLAKAINRGLPAGRYRASPDGIFTDNAHFQSIPACVNVSVGYDSQHSGRETLDYMHLFRLLDSLLSLDWSALPIPTMPEKSLYADMPWWDSPEIEKWSTCDDDLYDVILDEPELIRDFLRQHGVSAADILGRGKRR